MLPIKITRRASLQIQKAASWWLENRPKAPSALEEDLKRGLALIAQEPSIGSTASNVRLSRLSTAGQSVRLVDGRVVQTEIDRIGLVVVVYFHGNSARRRSKNAVTTCLGLTLAL